MLSREENDFLTQVGPGTPMGEVFRRFWLPALLSSELREPDCPPLRFRLLGEDLVAFRDTDGQVGVIDSACPHRRAHLFFGRNEECGLRCVYHGWKFDIKGNCVDMPSEPAESNFKDKVKIKAYPVKEFGGCVWLYMGPGGFQPEVPQMEWCRLPDTHRELSRWIQDSNYMQGAEGEIDTAHTTFLHKRFDPYANENPDRRGAETQVYGQRDGAPVLTVKEMDYGFVYGSRRNTGEGNYYWRVTQWMLPVYSITAGPRPGWPQGGRAYVPIDDEHTSVIQYYFSAGDPITEQERVGLRISPTLEKVTHRMSNGALLDTWRDIRNADNDYMLDREAQKTVSFTGISSARSQDEMVTDGMGAVADRTKEHLGTTDAAIIRARRMLLKLARDLQEGVEPYPALHGDVYRVRSIHTFSPQPDFHKFLEEHREDAIARE